MTAAMAVLGFIQFAIAATWLLNVSQAVSATRVLATQIARFDSAHTTHTTQRTRHDTTRHDTTRPIVMTMTGCAHSAGYNPAQLLINAWDGETFSSLTSFFSNISSALAARAQYLPHPGSTSTQPCH
jgi:hypothetical protein